MNICESNICKKTGPGTSPGLSVGLRFDIKIIPLHKLRPKFRSVISNCLNYNSPGCQRPIYSPFGNQRIREKDRYSVSLAIQPRLVSTDELTKKKGKVPSFHKLINSMHPSRRGSLNAVTKGIPPEPTTSGRKNTRIIATAYIQLSSRYNNVYPPYRTRHNLLGLVSSRFISSPTTIHT